jgi:hypothetical protein
MILKQVIYWPNLWPEEENQIEKWQSLLKVIIFKVFFQ